MRCPKCGYISFDHLESCLKCKKKIKPLPDNLSGSAYNSAPPVFLKFVTEAPAEAGQDDDIVLFEEPGEDDEIIDPDLDILFDDEVAEDQEPEIHFDPLNTPVIPQAKTPPPLSTPSEESGEISFSLEDDDEIAIDLGLFAEKPAAASAPTPAGQPPIPQSPVFEPADFETMAEEAPSLE